MSQAFEPGAGKITYGDTHAPATRHDEDAALLCDDHERLLRAIYRDWPSQQDIAVLLGAPVSMVALTHGTICSPYAKLLSEPAMSPRDVLCRPDPGQHIVLIAKRCLMLATLLQGLPADAMESLTKMIQRPDTISRALFSAATRFVTSNDELLRSLEGIECLMLESMYHNNAGELKCAWLVNRRAVAMAQMLGVHTGNKNRRMVLVEDTWDRIDLSCMWRRLIATDRYLSLMLGLPQASEGTLSDDVDATGLDRMEQLQIQAGGLLLSAQTGSYDDAMKVDSLLLQSASCMLPSWWADPPNFAAMARNSIQSLQETFRVMMQFTHYHLLIRCHLPFLLRQPPDGMSTSYDYSELTAANASRSVLDLYIAFRSGNHGLTYCRGIDYIAFVACVALCLLHIEVKHLVQVSETCSQALQSLKHQELCGRGRCERVLRIMEDMSTLCKDVIAGHIAKILKALLHHDQVGMHADVKDDANHDSAEDEVFNVMASHGSLRIRIPHLDALQVDGKAVQGDIRDSSIDTLSLTSYSALDGVDLAFFNDIGIDWSFGGINDVQVNQEMMNN